MYKLISIICLITMLGCSDTTSVSMLSTGDVVTKTVGSLRNSDSVVVDVTRLEQKVDNVPDGETITNIVNEVNGKMWDDTLSITWEFKADDGNVYVVPITNIDATVLR